MTEPKSWEEWKPIPGVDGNVEISNRGRIRKGEIVDDCSLDRDDYPRRSLTINGVKKRWAVHRLVMLAFVGPSELFVNHKNGIKSDNRLENLEYCTHSENVKHAFRTGLSVNPKGVLNGNVFFTEEQVYEIRANVKDSHNALARKYGTAQTVIAHIRLRETWKHLPIQPGPQWSPDISYCGKGHMRTDKNWKWVPSGYGIHGQQKRKRLCLDCEKDGKHKAKTSKALAKFKSDPSGKVGE